MATVPTNLFCQIQANSPGLEFLKPYPSSERERKFRSGSFTSSTEREIRRFHVVVDGKEMYKKHDARAKLLFC